MRRCPPRCCRTSRSRARASAPGSRWPTICRTPNAGCFIAPTAEEQAAAATALAPILASYEEAIAAGVIAPDGFSYAHLAIASSVLRFALVEEKLGVRVLQAAPRFEALMRRLAVRPSIAETVPVDYAELLVRKLTDRGSLYVQSRR